MKELYDKLIEAELRKKEAILQNEAGEIQAWTAEEQRLLDEFEEWSRKRQEALIAWQRQRGLATNPRATLSDVLAALDDEGERAAVREISRQLRDAAGKLKAAAEANRDLTQLSRDMLTKAVLPGAETGDDYIYRNPNQEPSTTRRSSGYDVRL